MGLFDIFKKETKPYKDDSVNLVYDLLFCDNIELYKNIISKPYQYPWDILLSDTPDIPGLVRIIDDPLTETRVKILACHNLRKSNQQIRVKKLLAVIVEVGLEKGLDVLASFADGTARYINQTGKLLVWETTDAQSNAITYKLFTESENIVKQIGPWNEPRKSCPMSGNLRITFLAADGLYFGEGPINTLFNDPLAGPALRTATELMTYLTENAMRGGRK